MILQIEPTCTLKSPKYRKRSKKEGYVSLDTLLNMLEDAFDHDDDGASEIALMADAKTAPDSPLKKEHKCQEVQLLLDVKSVLGTLTKQCSELQERVLTLESGNKTQKGYQPGRGFGISNRNGSDKRGGDRKAYVKNPKEGDTHDKAGNSKKDRPTHFAVIAKKQSRSRKAANKGVTRQLRDSDESSSSDDDESAEECCYYATSGIALGSTFPELTVSFGGVR